MGGEVSSPAVCFSFGFGLLPLAFPRSACRAFCFVPCLKIVCVVGSVPSQRCHSFLISFVRFLLTTHACPFQSSSGSGVVEEEMEPEPYPPNLERGVRNRGADRERGTGGGVTLAWTAFRAFFDSGRRNVIAIVASTQSLRSGGPDMNLNRGSLVSSLCLSPSRRRPFNRYC